jgi:hypothetical protein
LVQVLHENGLGIPDYSQIHENLAKTTALLEIFLITLPNVNPQKNYKFFIGTGSFFGSFPKSGTGGSFRKRYPPNTGTDLYVDKGLFLLA